jgi:energy-coupling factor transporter ATP-binding protein EcfA2
MPPIIELAGIPGCGKTTLSACLSELLYQQKMLLIDTDPEQQLVFSLTQQLASITLADVLASMENKLGNSLGNSQESVDWSFNELPVSINETQDILAMGLLPLSPLSVMAFEKLQYGLGRLIQSYDLVVVDGQSLVLKQLFPNQEIQSIELLLPEQPSLWRLPETCSSLHTHAIILNQSGTQQFELPPELNAALQQGSIQLLGRLPHYEDESALQQNMPILLKQCLLRLNTSFPFESCFY